jgi:hypothetical protein
VDPDPDPQHCFLAPELSTTAIVNDKGENFLITVIIICSKVPFYEQSVKKNQAMSTTLD